MYALLATLASTCVQATAHQESTQDAHALLQRMTWAVQMLNYEGTFVYRHNDQLESMQIAHMVDGDDEFERLLSLNGTAREIIRDNDKVTCIWPDLRSVLIEKQAPRRAFPVVLPKALDELGKLYKFVTVGDGRMLGRAVQRVAIKPRDRHRYGYVFWLDSGTALPLKSHMVDEEGRVVEEIMFTSLRLYEEFMADKVRPVTDGAAFRWIETQEPEVLPDSRTRRWTFGGVPGGYTMTSHTLQRGVGQNPPVEHMLYSDGLASFSVYIEPANAEGGLLGESHMGAVNAYGLTTGGYQVTVVGEVPAATVRAVGESVVFDESVAYQ